ncbi:hypothetical protein DMENIID0001_158480 [Sergentomyia squamirostris]
MISQRGSWFPRNAVGAPKDKRRVFCTTLAISLRIMATDLYHHCTTNRPLAPAINFRGVFWSKLSDGSKESCKNLYNKLKISGRVLLVWAFAVCVFLPWTLNGAACYTNY